MLSPFSLFGLVVEGDADREEEEEDARLATRGVAQHLWDIVVSSGGSGGMHAGKAFQALYDQFPDDKHVLKAHGVGKGTKLATLHSDILSFHNDGAHGGAGTITALMREPSHKVTLKVAKRLHELLCANGGCLSGGEAAQMLYERHPQDRDTVQALGGIKRLALRHPKFLHWQMNSSQGLVAAVGHEAVDHGTRQQMHSTATAAHHLHEIIARNQGSMAISQAVSELYRLYPEDKQTLQNTLGRARDLAALHPYLLRFEADGSDGANGIFFALCSDDEVDDEFGEQVWWGEEEEDNEEEEDDYNDEEARRDIRQDTGRSSPGLQSDSGFGSGRESSAATTTHTAATKAKHPQVTVAATASPSREVAPLATGTYRRQAAVANSSPPSDVATPSPQLVNLPEDLQRVATELQRELLSGSDGGRAVTALDCEGVPDDLFVLQLATRTRTLVFDCVQLGAKHVLRALAPVLESERVVKLMHDVHCDAVAIARENEKVTCRGVFDTQLAYELVDGYPLVGMNNLLAWLGCKTHDTKDAMHKAMDKDPGFWVRRPMPADVLEYAALDVRLLLDAHDSLVEQLRRGSRRSSRRRAAVRTRPWQVRPRSRELQAQGAAQEEEQEDLYAACLQGSALRYKWAIQHESFRVMRCDADAGHKLISVEARPQHHQDHGQGVEEPRVTSSNVMQLLRLLPAEFWPADPEDYDGDEEAVQLWNAELGPDFCDRLMEVHFYVGQKARAHFCSDAGGGRSTCYLGDQYQSPDERVLVSLEHVQAAVERLGGEEKFGSDNRAGLEQCLHRISAVRNKQGTITGLTLRVGRAVRGATRLVEDVLRNEAMPSILVLGEPGSGKTTLVREICQALSSSGFGGQRVCVVDTSNELGGDGDVAHECLGEVLRVMVPSLDKQHAVMIECVQNHTPEVMVIDEIGRPNEAEAARTVKERGVRMVASAHGDFVGLMRNPKLKNLLGATQQSIRTGGTPVTTRVGTPTFEVIVELDRHSRNECTVILDAAHALDRRLRGEAIVAQRRRLDPATGHLTVKLFSLR